MLHIDPRSLEDIKCQQFAEDRHDPRRRSFLPPKFEPPIVKTFPSH